MEMKKNNKGFTLIELLAVITILAIIMLLAARSVTAVLSDAQKKAFVLDAQNVVESAKLAYTDALLNNKTQGKTKFCMSIDYLKAHGLEKKDDSLKGSILVDVTTPTAAYSIWLSNGQFELKNILLSDLDKDDVKGYTADADVKCQATTGSDIVELK